MSKIIAVVSGKGGTGKTTTVAALSSCLAALGHRTLCVSLDNSLKALDLALCVPDHSSPGNVFTPEGYQSISEICFEHPLIPNLFLLGVPVFNNSEKLSAEFYDTMFGDIRNEFAYCVIDTQTGNEINCMFAHTHADTSIIVTTGDLRGMGDALAAASSAKEVGVADLRLIVNRVRRKNLEILQIEIDDIIDAVGLTLIGLVSEDKNVFRAMHEEIPLALYHRRGAAYDFLDISRRIAGEFIPWRIKIQQQPPQADEAASEASETSMAAEVNDDGQAASESPSVAEAVVIPEAEVTPEADVLPETPSIPETPPEPEPEPPIPEPTESETEPEPPETEPEPEPPETEPEPDESRHGSDTESASGDASKKPAGAKYNSDMSIKLPEHLLGAYGDPANWARSTFVPDEDEHLVLIHEIKPTGQTGRGTFLQRTWLHDILDDNNIPYHIEVGGHWHGRRKFEEIQSVYVRQQFSGLAIGLIRAYDNPGNIVREGGGFEDEFTFSEDGIPQKNCPSCGADVDFDCYKCPQCKAIVAMGDTRY